MIKLAIVDDHKLFRSGLRAILGDLEDIEILFEAENGKELINQLDGQVPNVVLMDLEMPEMDGVEATKHLNEFFPDIKVLMLTMHDDDKFMLHLMDCGAHGYLLKNVAKEELVKAIRTVSESDFYFNDRLSMAMLKNIGKKTGWTYKA